MDKVDLRTDRRTDGGKDNTLLAGRARGNEKNRQLFKAMFYFYKSTDEMMCSSSNQILLK